MSAETVSGTSVSACAPGAKRMRHPARRSSSSDRRLRPLRRPVRPLLRLRTGGRRQKHPTIERMPSTSWMLRPSEMLMAYSMA